MGSCGTCQYMCKVERWGTHVGVGSQTFLMSYNHVTPVFCMFLPLGILKTPSMYPSFVVTSYSSQGYPWYLIISLCGKPKESLLTCTYSVEVGGKGVQRLLLSKDVQLAKNMPGRWTQFHAAGLFPIVLCYTSGKGPYRDSCRTAQLSGHVSLGNEQIYMVKQPWRGGWRMPTTVREADLSLIDVVCVRSLMLYLSNWNSKSWVCLGRST